MAFLSPASVVRDDLSRLLASPAQFLPSPLGGPHGLFASPAPPSKAGFAVQEGRLSFDVLLQEHDGQERPRGACALEGMRGEDAPSSKGAHGSPRQPPQPPCRLPTKGVRGRAARGGVEVHSPRDHNIRVEQSPGHFATLLPLAWPTLLSHPAAAARSASHLELFALPTGAERSKSGDLAAAVAAEQAALQAALTERVVAKVVAASQQEAHDLVAGVAAKYGLVGDYGRAEETIKAVWGQRVSEAARRLLGGGGGGGEVVCCNCSAVSPPAAARAGAVCLQQSCI